ncbi:MAG: hypothetical protein IJ935_07970 [Afipia sp.]|nr:hypothetical protein [Afipia sp.]
MQKTGRKNKPTKNRMRRARSIVVTCMRLSGKNIRPDFIDLIAERVLRDMRPHLARRLAKSLDGQAMKAAMELTRRYFQKYDRGATAFF